MLEILVRTSIRGNVGSCGRDLPAGSPNLKAHGNGSCLPSQSTVAVAFKVEAFRRVRNDPAATPNWRLIRQLERCCRLIGFSAPIANAHPPRRDRDHASPNDRQRIEHSNEAYAHSGRFAIRRRDHSSDCTPPPRHAQGWGRVERPLGAEELVPVAELPRTRD
jgi:hypothetical protein